MKLFCFFFFFFTHGINTTKGQLAVELSGEIHLRFVFHPYYNYFEKSCCKFGMSRCIIFVNNIRYAADAYKSRINIYEYSGCFVVQIWNVHATDSGTYRCEIHGTQNHIYQDFQVVIADSETGLNPVLAFPKSTISPVTSVHNLSGKHQEVSSNRWSLKLTLGTVFVVVVIVLIISIIPAVVYHKKKARDKCGRSILSSPSVTQQPPQELIYATVNFKPNEKASNIYANLNIHNLRPNSGNALKTEESVEYSTIAAVL